jgi:pyruvate kinase
MSVARLNLAHCTHAFAAKVIADVREISASNPQMTPCAVWLDINGPKVRSGKLVDGGPVHLKKGDDFYFVNDREIIGDNTKVNLANC